MEDKLVINMHCVKIKGVVLGGKADGPTGGPPTMEPSKEVRKKKLKKTNPADQPAKEVLDVAPLQIIIPDTIQYSLHACDKPPMEDNILKICLVKTLGTSSIGVPVVETFINDILNDKHVETEDSRDEKSLEIQDEVVENDVNINIDIHHNDVE
ncbi:unnamed protein product [Vicia faba]|uniref:Uncharacterized protein n=1 Tax=Vicia faba TaxID=3906 RepID=A0AAV0YVN5_VICFA|nr:unnamed protein product [Vicia faba]